MTLATSIQQKEGPTPTNTGDRASNPQKLPAKQPPSPASATRHASRPARRLPRLARKPRITLAIAFALLPCHEPAIGMATIRASGPDRRWPAPTCALLGRSAPSGLSRPTDRRRLHPAPAPTATA